MLISYVNFQYLAPVLELFFISRGDWVWVRKIMWKITKVVSFSVYETNYEPGPHETPVGGEKIFYTFYTGKITFWLFSWYKMVDIVPKILEKNQKVVS